jgi:hypothetical protein
VRCGAWLSCRRFLLPIAAVAQPVLAVQTAPQICVWSEAGAEATTTWRISKILAHVEAYWAPEPVPGECIPEALRSHFAPPAAAEQPLATVLLYETAEAMHRDLRRFDVAGLTISVDPFESPGLRERAIADRFASGMVLEGLSLLTVCCYSDGDWERITAHEPVHALQFAHWVLDPDAVTDAHSTLLMEGRLATPSTRSGSSTGSTSALPVRSRSGSRKAATSGSRPGSSGMTSVRAWSTGWCAAPPRNRSGRSSAAVSMRTAERAGR